MAVRILAIVLLFVLSACSSVSESERAITGDPVKGGPTAETGEERKGVAEAGQSHESFMGRSREPASRRSAANIVKERAAELERAARRAQRTGAADAVSRMASAAEAVDPGYIRVLVWYATDRTVGRSGDPSKFFGTGRGQLSYGRTYVSMPEDHRLGELEKPKWYQFLTKPNPKKHVLLLSVEPFQRDKFLSAINKQVSSSKDRDVLVFIHGYNVTFEDAARRTAQLAYDLNLQGAPILYSWPSQGKYLGYFKDSANAEWAIPNLERVLKEIAAHSGAQKIHLVAHSMGNKPLIKALERIAQERDQDVPPQFNEIVLTAPDIDAEVFVDLAQRILPVGKRITLYASKNDTALAASEKLVGGHHRAGDTEPNVVIVDGIDTIDASNVKTDLVGHSYFGDNRTVLHDLFALLKTGKPPSERFGLGQRTYDNKPYWIILQ